MRDGNDFKGCLFQPFQGTSYLRDYFGHILYVLSYFSGTELVLCCLCSGILLVAYSKLFQIA